LATVAKSGTKHRPATVSSLEPVSIELSVVMPCLNEAETIGACIRKAKAALEQANVAGEVIVGDNGSTDGSVEMAERLGAKVVRVKAKGYGSALMGGIAAAAGKYIVMGDADDSYEFGHIPRFLEQLRNGSDLVVGNRFRGGIKPGAMPTLHQLPGQSCSFGIGKTLFQEPGG